MTFTRSSPARRLRPSAPRCRGGVSSVLRLAAANHGASPSWFGALAPISARAVTRITQAEEPEAVLDVSIITRLLPSHELARS